MAAFQDAPSPRGASAVEFAGEHRLPLGTIAALASAAALVIALGQGGAEPSAPVLMAVGLGGLAAIGGKRRRL